MVEPVTPKANRHVIDGEILGETLHRKAKGRKRASTSRHSSHHAAHSQKRAKKIEPSRSLASDLSLLMNALREKSTFALFTLLLTLAVLLTWLWQSQVADNSWQIERINQLQSQMGAQQISLNALKTQLNAQSNALATLTADASKPDNLEQDNFVKSDVFETVADEVKGLQQDITGLVAAYQARYALSNDEVSTVKQQMSDAVVVAKGVVDVVEESVKTQISALTTEENLKQIDEFKADLNTKLASLGSQVSALFAVNDQKARDKKAQAQEQKKFENAIKTPLSAYKLQAWVLDINTQWLLAGQAAQTKKQLLSLEQAVGLSELPSVNKLSLARFIGEDINQLAHVTSSNPLAAQNAITVLKEWLPRGVVGHTVKTATAVNAKNSALPATDTVVEHDNLTRLKNAFSDVFRIQQREENSAVTLTEKTLLADVILQRGLLLLERIEWAVTSQSPTLLAQSLADFKRFNATFTQLGLADKVSVSTALNDLNTLSLTQREPLTIMSFQHIK